MMLCCFLNKVTSFKLKDNFVHAIEPLAWGTMFYKVSVVQITWMLNCGYQRVVVKERNFVVVNDLDLKRVLRKALEKLVIFSFNTKTLTMDHQHKCRLNNWSIFEAFFKEITWRTEPFIFRCQQLQWQKFLQGTVDIVSHEDLQNVQFFFQNKKTEAIVARNSSSQGVRE